ncbi:hypothetical protein D8674_006043 [Pyrus ussuriensis x Pyrus communis]|uniref:Uncharacterized protein n=1 Tax=Pyrus ussuriensis x Pyrus communis TaxID=2448454 RepID=A0A5N5FT58_9ROSA|nr:hypothetical protein D8674_006043 [Pyrus ussuriensis x Pyrus communis]
MASSSTFLTPATNLNTLFSVSNGQVRSKKDCDIFIRLCQPGSIEWMQGLMKEILVCYNVALYNLTHVSYRIITCFKLLNE